MRKAVVNTTPLIALKPTLHQMIEHGIYISNDLAELCLKQESFLTDKWNTTVNVSRIIMPE